MTGIERHDTDILILGSGGAGLFAALHAQQTNPEVEVTLAVKGLIGKSGCTRMVQGGYNVALPGTGDSVERHFMDTIKGGGWLPHQGMAWKLCELAVERIRELENEVGCFFDRNPDGSVHQKAFAGQTADRTVHKGDLTGIEIISRLMEKVLRARPVKLQEHRAIALIPTADKSAIAGVLFIDMRTGGFRFVRAKAVLLATGGGPTMYKYHTPSGDKTMDGLAMALRVGLPLRDMEMVQFHPTGLMAGPGTRMTGTVLEEGLRGAGGHLLNHAGKRFMFDYDERGERATRDVVSRGIYAEMRKSNAGPITSPITSPGFDPGPQPEFAQTAAATRQETPGRRPGIGASGEVEQGVFIAMGHLGAEKVAAKFPGMVKRCADCGFDLAGGQVEVVPTAHYLMGGVVTDPDCRTALEGLYVAGEDAGGAHGSNRLGGNGVANSTVYGGVAGEVMARDILKNAHGMTLRDPDEGVMDAEIARALIPFANKPTPVQPLRENLQNLMWEYAGVMRNAAGLEAGVRALGEVRKELATLGVDGSARAFNLGWHDWLNLQSLTDISEVITQASIARENSRGAHYREDFTDKGSLEESYFTVVRQEGDQEGNRGALKFSRENVDFEIVAPGETVLPESEPESLVG